MRSLLIPLFLFFFSVADAINIRTEIEEAQKNQFIPKLISPCTSPTTVDVIKGTYQEKQADFTVAGAQPLSLHRFYYQTFYDPRYGGWIFNPETFAVANFELPGLPQFVGLGEKNGELHCYEKVLNYTKGTLIEGSYLFDIAKQKTEITPSSDYKPLNTKILFHRDSDIYCSYKGVISSGDGRVRTFTTPLHCWVNLRKVPPSTNPTTGEVLSELSLPPTLWTPYQLLITEEKQPNGNILSYAYDTWKDETIVPNFKLLKSITAYNASKTKMLGALQFRYDSDSKGNIHGILIEGSDGRKASFTFAGNPLMLVSAKTPEDLINYRYNGTNLISVEKLQRGLTTEYYPKSNKVKSQSIGGDSSLTNRFVYQAGYTEIYDGENNKKIYRYDENKRVIAEEIYDNNQLYQVNRSHWDPRNGTLLSKTIEDGAGKVITKNTYHYDRNLNLVQENYGDDRITYTLYRKYSGDGLNLKLSEWDDFGKKTTYSYRPRTNLLEKEFVWDQDQIRQRHFYIYDDCAVCIREIVDDGSGENSDDLHHVTYRLIKDIQPKQSHPCFGLPEVVEEKTLDSMGKEILIHKIRYTYAPSGKVLKEEHFDSTGAFAYALVNEYDDKERLIAKIDPLGNRTAYIYEANSTEVVGPRKDMHIKTTFDKAGMPIKVEQKQSDGTYLCTQKVFNNCGHLIASIDECGQKTAFVNDVMGRPIKITYPDGTGEEKKYDLLGNVIYEKDGNGFITKKAYDFRGNLTHISYPDGTEEHLVYLPNGRLDYRIERNKTKTIFTYDGFGHLIETAVYSPDETLLKKTSATWSPFLQLSSTDAAGRTTYFIYDRAGRKIEEQFESKVTSYAYDKLGRLFKTIQGDVVTIYAFDFLNRPVEMRIETADGKNVRLEHYVYDEAGNRTHIVRNNGTETTLYDSCGRRAAEIDSAGHKTTFVYTYKKQLTKTQIAPNGVQTLTLHNSRGWPVDCQVKNAKGDIIKRTEFIYDGVGNLSKRIDHVYVGTSSTSSVIHTWLYGPGNRLERFLEGENKEALYSYDEVGRLQTITSPSKNILTFEYDDLNRIVRYFGTDFDYVYTYDKNDRLISALDKITKEVTRRTYDVYGNLSHETLGNGYQLGYTFDFLGRRLGLTFADGSNAKFTYRGFDLYQVSRNQAVYTYEARDARGYPIQIKLPGNLGTFSIERDSLSRWKKGSSPYYAALFDEKAYDSAGNLLSYKYADILGTTEEIYSYDDLNHLKKENTHTYLFDSLGNCIQKDKNNQTVNALCQLTSDGKHKYTYDANGNLTSNGKIYYEYDSQGRLISVKEGPQKIEFTYDPFHRRLSKKVSLNGNLLKILYFIWEGETEIGVLDEQKKAIELRIMGDTSVFYELGGKPYVPIHNHQGSVVALVDYNKKSRAETYRYTAFGEEITVVKFSPWRFADKRVDDETGLSLYGSHFYNPFLGRWLNPIPKGLEASRNPYTFSLTTKF